MGHGSLFGATFKTGPCRTHTSLYQHPSARPIKQEKSWWHTEAKPTVNSKVLKGKSWESYCSLCVQSCLLAFAYKPIKYVCIYIYIHICIDTWMYSHDSYIYFIYSFLIKTPSHKSWSIHLCCPACTFPLELELEGAPWTKVAKRLCQNWLQTYISISCGYQYSHLKCLKISHSILIAYVQISQRK